MLYECLAIVNSFLIDLPDAHKKFGVSNSELKSKLEQILQVQSAKVVEIALRLIRNLISRGVLDSVEIPKGVMSKVRDIELVASLARFVHP